MKENELKPCPFCGGKANIKLLSTGHQSNEYSAQYAIGCRECKYDYRQESRWALRDGEMVKTVDGYAMCIEWWNRRATDERPREADRGDGEKNAFSLV